MFAWGLAQDARTTLLSSAVRAPSMHNSQPWRFEIGPNSAHVYRDLDRWLQVEDPHQSALYMSLGAAVLNLRVAAAELGRLAQVTLFPEPEQPDYVARVWLATGLGIDAELAALFPYVSRRRTNRHPFADRWIPDRALRELGRAARAENALLQVVRDPDDVRRLLNLAAEGATDEMYQFGRLQERARWVGGERADDGIPATALGPLPVENPPLVRDLAVRSADRQRPAARFERHPVLALLSVRRDDPLGWLGAGQALERVLLTATRWGLSASFLNQALDCEGWQWPAQTHDGTSAYPQMLLRLGYGRLTEAIPRRPLHEFAAQGQRPQGGQ